MIALEPEAAAIFCQEKNLSDFHSETGRRSVDAILSQPHSNYMVIDIGGMLLFCFIFLHDLNVCLEVNQTAFADLWTLKVRLLEPKYLKEDDPVTTCFENILRFSSFVFFFFFCNKTNTIQGSSI